MGVGSISNSNEVQQLIQAIKNAKNVFMTVHVGPDGDALGAMLGLKHGLNRHCPQLERIDCVMEGKMPDVFHFMPGIHDVKDILKDKSTLLETYDVAISLDCGSADRLGENEKVFNAAKISVNIDHHISNKHFGNINIVIPQASASGEVVADILEVMDIPLDADSGACIYMALVTDTGGFKFSNASSKSYRLAGQCIDAGANHEEIYKQVYERRTRPQALLMADALMHAQFNEDETLSWVGITQEMWHRNKALEEHTDGIVDSLRQIDSVLIAAVFKESQKNQTRVSLRSDDHNINVAAVVEAFGGGGHKMASGCTIEKPLAEAQEEILTALKKLLPQKVKNA